METSLLGAEGSDKAFLLGSEVGYLLDFSLGGLGSEVGSTEGESLRASQGHHSCLGGGSYSSMLDSSG